MMEDKKTFGEYVSKRRKEMGFTQKEFAEKLYITESAVSKWERGLSYPDVTLIRDICEILAVSEHELLTASEDVEARNSEKLAKNYISLVNRYRNTLSFLYGVSLLVCFICNIAVQHTLSWFFIVLAAEMVAMSLTLLPVMVSEKKGLITLGAFSVSLFLLLLICNIYSGGSWFIVAFMGVLLGITLIFMPYVLYNIWLPDVFTKHKALIYFSIESFLLFLLLLVCDLYSNGGWFIKSGLPIALFCLLVPWGMMFVIRYLNIHAFLKAAACFGILSAFYYCVQGVISAILGDGEYGLGFPFDFTNWSESYFDGNINMIIFLVLFSFTLLFLILGIIRTVRAYDVSKV